MPDNEQTLASLGHAEELRVEYPPCQTVPARIQGFEQASEILPMRARERSWDVLPKKPTRLDVANCSNVLPHEAAGSIQSCPPSRDREGLAGASADDDVWLSICFHRFLPVDFRDVPEIGHAGEAFGKHGAREGVYLGEGQRLPSEWFPRDRRGLYAAEKRDVLHHAPLSASARHRFLSLATFLRSLSFSSSSSFARFSALAFAK